jgi:sugar/nucleoside kinase (ribokinase family)
MKKADRLWVISNIIMDILTFVDDFPERSADILAKHGHATPGGAFNVIAAATKLGMKTIYGGLVGTGPFGDVIMQRLEAMGVTLANNRIPGHDTGFDVAIVEKNGEPTFITALGSESRLDMAHLADLAIRAEDAVYLSGYNLIIQPSASALRTWVPFLRDNLVLLDPGPLVGDIDPTVLARVMHYTDIFSVNQREAFLLTGWEDPLESLTALHNRFGDTTAIIVRSGAQGSWIMDNLNRPLNVPTIAVKPVNTMGAGDVHTAALVTRMQEVPWEQAVFEANICASLATEREDPADSPTLAELHEFLRGIRR